MMIHLISFFFIAYFSFVVVVLLLSAIIDHAVPIACIVAALVLYGYFL